MTIDELQKKRAAFKAKVLEYLKDSTLSYRQVGDLTGVSAWRVCQIRRESGMPNRVGGRRGSDARQVNRVTPGIARTEGPGLGCQR